MVFKLELHQNHLETCQNTASWAPPHEFLLQEKWSTRTGTLNTFPGDGHTLKTTGYHTGDKVPYPL